MKKLYTFFILMSVFSINAQTIPVTFETGNGVEVDVSFVADNVASVSIVADPDSSVTDHGQVGKVTTDPAEVPWQNAQIKFQEGSNYADLTTNKVITFDCYSTVAFDGLLKLEESLGGQAAVQQSFQHTGSGWEAISVDFSTLTAPANDEFKKIVFFFYYDTDKEGGADFLSAAEVTAFGAFDIYLDNITADVGATIQTPAPAAAATAPTADAADVVSVYSDHYTATATNVAWEPEWGQTTSYEEYDLNGDGSDVMAKLSSFGYEGITFDALDITSETLHLDVWSSDETSIKVFLDNDNFVQKTLTTNSWNSINIPISDFVDGDGNPIDVSAVSSIKLESGTWTWPNGTSLIYVDNVYFHSQPSDDTVITFSVDTTNSPYPNTGYDNVVINGSWNGWNGWGVTLADDDGDGIFTGELTLAKTTGAVEYVVAVTGATDGYSGWGDQSGASALCVETVGNYTFTTGANALSQNLILLDDVSGDHWACLTSDANVTVTIIVDATANDAAHPTHPDGGAVAGSGHTVQLGLRSNVTGWSDYGIPIYDGPNYLGESGADAGKDGIWTAQVSRPFYSSMEYVVEADGPDDTDGNENPWNGDDGQSKNASTGDNFSLTVSTSDVTEQLSVTAEDTNGNWVVYTSTLSVGGVEVDLTFNLYPNPVVDLVILDARESIQAVQIFDLMGRVVLSRNINSNKSQIDLSNLQNGVYILEAKINDQTAVTKFIKQ